MQHHKASELQASDFLDAAATVMRKQILKGYLNLHINAIGNQIVHSIFSFILFLSKQGSEIFSLALFSHSSHSVIAVRITWRMCENEHQFRATVHYIMVGF